MSRQSVPWNRMRGPLSYGVLGIAMALLLLLGITQAPLQASANERSRGGKAAAVSTVKTKTTKTSAPKAGPMMRMPLVLPLFLQDQQFTSTIVLVNGSAESTYADVTLTGLDGKEINHRRVEFTPHSQRVLEVKDLLREVASPAVMGRTTITQSPDLKGMAIAAQLSMTYLGSLNPTYIDEEAAMPWGEGSQVLRAVADRASGSPVMAVTSLTDATQHITLECLSETGVNFSSTLDLGPQQTAVVQACAHRTFLDSDFETREENGKTDRVVGVGLNSDAMPGSFAAFALAPHKEEKGRHFSAVNFSDPKMTLSPNTIFTGVPVGSPSLLPEGQYVPHITLANFSFKPIHVQIQCAQTDGNAPTVKSVKDLILAGRSTRLLTLDNLQGNSTLQNSFVINSDGPPGDLMANLVSTSESTLHEVEILGKDQNTGNGGSHPWSLEQGNDATLLIFNPTSSSQGFTVMISGGSLLWQKVYQLEPIQTEQINIRNLILQKVPDDKGKTLPEDSQSGLVEWFSHVDGKGRLLESNPQLAMARNFSCTGYYCLCQPTFASGTTTYPMLSTVGFGSIHGNVCQSPNPGPCCNQGSTVQTDTSGYNYSWSSGNTSIAQISGSSTSQSVNTYGPGPGSTPVTGSMCDPATGCCISQPPTATVQKPGFLQVISQTPDNTVCLGLSCASILKYKVLDVNGAPMNIAGMTIAESVGSFSGTCPVGDVSDSSTWPTDSTGTMIGTDEVFACCYGATCGISWNQTFTVNGFPVIIMNQAGTLTGSHNAISVSCTNGNGSCSNITITP